MSCHLKKDLASSSSVDFLIELTIVRVACNIDSNSLKGTTRGPIWYAKWSRISPPALAVMGFAPAHAVDWSEIKETRNRIFTLPDVLLRTDLRLWSPPREVKTGVLPTVTILCTPLNSGASWGTWPVVEEGTEAEAEEDRWDPLDDVVWADVDEGCKEDDVPVDEVNGRIFWKVYWQVRL